MRKLALTATSLLGLMLYASSAWACMGAEDLLLIGLMFAPVAALPYTLVGSTAIAWRAGRWFARPTRGWFLASFGLWVVCSLGAAAGLALAFLAGGALNSEHLALAVGVSTPFVVEVAYLMWLHSRRFKR